MNHIVRIVAAVCLCVGAVCCSDDGTSQTITFLDLSHLREVRADDARACRLLWDELHCAATLQGVVNRREPLLYIDYVANEFMEVDRFWWDTCRSGGGWLYGRDTVACGDVVQAVERFADRLRGAVVYDPEVASTSCVASAVAGAEDLVAIRYDTTAGSLYDRLVVHGPRLKVRVWLVNRDGTSMFTGRGTVPQTDRASTGSVKVDPYVWFVERYMKRGRCNGEYGAYYLDQYWLQRPSAAPMNAHCLTNHDFFVSRRGFFFDLSPWGDEAATDDPAQSVGCDRTMLLEMLGEAYRLNEGKRMCHIGGFPAWAYKYTRHAGGSHEDVATEWEFSRLISAYNAFKDADAIGYGAMANASFWQHYPTAERYPQRWVDDEDLRRRGYIDETGGVRIDGRKFMIFYVGDYDASSWITSVLPHLWNDPARGELPLMWCISPVLERRAPMVLDYVRRTAGPNDYFAAADNGAGYLMPGMLQSPRPVSGLPDGLDVWAGHCRPLYEKWGLTITGFIIDGEAPALDSRGLACYASFSPDGIVPQKTPRTRLYGEMPVLRAGADLVGTPEESAAFIVEDMRRSPIPFGWYRDILKSPSWHVEVMEHVRRLDPTVELLDAPTFFELYRRWQRENPEAAAGQIE